jgi:hypothetical protein
MTSSFLDFVSQSKIAEIESLKGHISNLLSIMDQVQVLSREVVDLNTQVSLNPFPGDISEFIDRNSEILKKQMEITSSITGLVSAYRGRILALTQELGVVGVRVV